MPNLGKPSAKHSCKFKGTQMDGQTLILMAAAVIGVAFLLQYNINQITKQIDIKDANGIDENQSAPKHGYERFCDFVIDELDALKMVKIKADLNSDEILDKLGDLSREIKYIKKMNQNSDESTWNAKLGEFLHKLDEFININFERGEAIANELRAKFKKEFASI